MSGILHKAEDALHHHHDQKPTQQNTFTQENQSGEHFNHQGNKQPNPSQEDKDRLEFNADRGFDHASKGSHGAGVGFEE